MSKSGKGENKALKATIVTAHNALLTECLIGYYCCTHMSNTP